MRDGWKRGTSLVRISKPFMLCIWQEAMSPSVPPLPDCKLYVLLFSCFLAFLTVPIQLLYWHLQKFSVEYLMVKTKFQQEATVPTLQYVWAAPYPCTQSSTWLGVGSVWFWFQLYLFPSTNSHFFDPLRKKVLNLAPVHNYCQMRSQSELPRCCLFIASS